MIIIRFVARHLIAKADDRVAQGVANKLLRQPLRQLRQLRLLRTFLRTFLLALRTLVRCVGWKPRFILCNQPYVIVGGFLESSFLDAADRKPMRRTCESGL